MIFSKLKGFPIFNILDFIQHNITLPKRHTPFEYGYRGIEDVEAAPEFSARHVTREAYKPRQQLYI